MMTTAKRKELYFHLKGKDDDELIALGKRLCTDTKITSLKFGGPNDPTITITGWTAIFIMLQINKTIDKLEFFGTFFNFDCAQLFAKTVLVTNNTLKELYFDYTRDVGMNCIDVIVDGLCSNPNGCPLTSLKFHHVIETHNNNNNNNNNTSEMKQQLATKFVTLLQKDGTKIKELNLSYNSFDDDFVSIFATGLKRNVNLEKLSLYTNGITTVGAIALANALYYNNTLVELDLQQNVIQDDGIIAITNALRYQPSLQILNIQRNEISVDCLLKLLEILKYNVALKDLSCHHNVEYQQLALSAFESIFNYNDTIQCIDLNLDSDSLYQILDENERCQRIAPKKGVLCRQQIYTWLSNDFGVQ